MFNLWYINNKGLRKHKIFKELKLVNKWYIGNKNKIVKLHSGDWQVLEIIRELQ